MTENPRQLAPPGQTAKLEETPPAPLEVKGPGPWANWQLAR